MKLLNKLLFFGSLISLLPACKKDEIRSVITPGVAPVLTASTASLVLDTANAANKTAITFAWPAMDFGAHIAPTYTLQIDSINGNFAKPVNFVLGNGLSKSFTVADFNTLVTSLALVPKVAGKIHARVKTDVLQSNGVATSIPTAFSNVIDLTVTPYSVKPTPKYPVPDSLYIVGNATPGDWGNPVPVPMQKFTKVDEFTFAMVINLVGGKAFVLLPKNGDWSHKYALSGSAGPTGGSFMVDAGADIPGPGASGLYKIVIDFVKATYTVTSVTTSPVPANLYIVGDATIGGAAHGWDNPVYDPAKQTFRQVSNGEFELTTLLITGKSYLLLPLNGNWDHKYGGTSKTEGALLADSAVPGSNTPAPDANGTYKINVNFFSMQYKVTQ